MLEHLGIKAGEKIELDLLPDGRGMIQAAKRSGTIEDFIGRLAGKTKKVAPVEEINEAAANGTGGGRILAISEPPLSRPSGLSDIFRGKRRRNFSVA